MPRLLLLLLGLGTYFGGFGQMTKVQITNIEVIGNKKTKTRIITRELDFKVGDSLQINDLERIERNENYIINSGLFVDAELSLVDVDEAAQQAITRVSVKEGWYIYPSPSISLADRNFSVWWQDQGRELRRLNLGLILIHQNFTGRADELKITVQGGFTRKLELRYKYPYLNKAQTLGLETGILYSNNNDIRYQTLQDKGVFYRDTTQNIFERFRFRLGLQYRPSLLNRHSFVSQYQNLTIDPLVVAMNPNFFLNASNRQRAFRLEYAFTSDHRDNRFYALKGYVLKLNAAKEGLAIFGDVNSLSATATFLKFWKLSKKVSLATTLKGHIGLLRTIQPYQNYRALGSKSNLVRGYQLYLIDGLDYTYLKTDIRYQVLDYTFNLGRLMPLKNYRSLPIQAYLVLYNDLGYVNDPFFENDSNTLNNRMLWGHGIGLDVVGYKVHVGKAVLTRNHLGEWGFFMNTEFAF